MQYSTVARLNAIMIDSIDFKSVSIDNNHE